MFKPRTFLKFSVKKILIGCLASVVLITLTYNNNPIKIEIPSQSKLNGNQGLMRDKAQQNIKTQRLPDVLIIGVKKGGTRALFTFLRMHPKISSPKKELHFFDCNENYSKGIKWYRKMLPWAKPPQIVAEKTPNYFHAERVARRIHTHLPNAKLILVVRDPIVRLVSDYLHTKEDNNYTSFEDAVMRKTENGTLEVNKDLWIVRTSLYHIHYQRFRNFFPQEQILVVSGERLIDEPWTEMERVQNFLGLNQKITKKNFVFVEEKGFWCLKNGTSEPICLGPLKGREHPVVRENVYELLRQFFAPSVQKFVNLTGADFCDIWLQGKI